MTKGASGSARPPRVASSSARRPRPALPSRGVMALMSEIPLLLERSIQQEIHGRGPLVAGHETLPEVAREIVVGGLRLGLDDAADRIGEAPLHPEAGKCGEDA